MYPTYMYWIIINDIEHSINGQPKFLKLNYLRTVKRMLSIGNLIICSNNLQNGEWKDLKRYIVDTNITKNKYRRCIHQ